MILILMNIFDMNKKKLYENTSKQQQQQPSSITQNIWTIFENFEGSWSNLPDD